MKEIGIVSARRSIASFLDRVCGHRVGLARVRMPTHTTGIGPVLLTVALLGAACGTGGTKGPLTSEPDLAGKADFADRVSMLGQVAIGEPTDGEFVEDFEYHGYTFLVAANSAVSLEVERASGVVPDTTLYVYGPRTAAGVYARRIAFDDDSGWGPLSRVRGLTISDAGEYLVVVGTYSGLGRGRYRLSLDCDLESCTDAELPAECPGRVRELVVECVEEWLADGDYEDTRHEAFEVCLTDFPDRFYDNVCEAAAEPWCVAGLDAFLETLIPVCRTAMAPDFPPDRDPLQLASRPVDAEVQSRTEDAASECCWVRVSAYAVLEAGAEVTLVWLVDSVRQLQEQASQWTVVDPVSVTNFQGQIEQYGLGDDFVDLLRAQAGAQTFELGLLHRNWYPAAGAEAWSDLYVLRFDNGSVITVLFESGET